LLKTTNEEVLVLLSGGLDSAACVDFYKQLERPPCAAFVDYGQAAARLEAHAAKAVAEYYSIPLLALTWRGVRRKGQGIIPGRNCFLISAALMERPRSVSAIGVHAGTHYSECGEPFLVSMQSVLQASENGEVQLASPFATWRKTEIVEYCTVRGVPVHMTYSCELGTDPPCGNCLSCLDRSSLVVSA
jgi:7-cyano-7-deazaguanine synthase